MSDVMLFGVLRMPYEMAMGSELSRRQFYARAQEAVDRLEAAERKVSRLTAMRNEWERDAREHLMTFGQHLPASVECLVERFDAAIAATQECEG